MIGAKNIERTEAGHTCDWRCVGFGIFTSCWRHDHRQGRLRSSKVLTCMHMFNLDSLREVCATQCYHSTAAIRQYHG